MTHFLVARFLLLARRIPYSSRVQKHNKTADFKKTFGTSRRFVFKNKKGKTVRGEASNVGVEGAPGDAGPLRGARRRRRPRASAHPSASPLPKE